MASSVRRVGWAIAGVGAAIVLAGCAAGSGSNGSSVAASATSGETRETPPTSVVGGNNATGSANSAELTTASVTPSGDSGGGGSVVASAELLDPTGAEVGTVEFAVDGTVVTVTAAVQGLPAGFKGFHVHAIGKCEPNSPNPTDPSKVGDFLSAGGHLGGADAAHPGHQGDLSSLQVREDGSAELVTTTDAFDVDALFDADGSAVIVHAGPDNFGNIPTRYAPTGRMLTPRPPVIPAGVRRAAWCRRRADPLGRAWRHQVSRRRNRVGQPAGSERCGTRPGPRRRRARSVSAALSGREALPMPGRVAIALVLSLERRPAAGQPCRQTGR